MARHAPARTADIVAAAGSGRPLDVVDRRRRSRCVRPGIGGIPNAVVGNSIAISEPEAERLIERFGRIRNTGTSVPPANRCGPACEDARNAVLALAATRAELSYSDGSQATRAVDWNMAQLEAIAQEASEERSRPARPVPSKA